jgi:hypothetical protein
MNRPHDTNSNTPQGVFAAMDQLAGVFIMLISSCLNILVVIVVRCSNWIADQKPAVQSESHFATPAMASREVIEVGEECETVLAVQAPAETEEPPIVMQKATVSQKTTSVTISPVQSNPALKTAKKTASTTTSSRANPEVQQAIPQSPLIKRYVGTVVWCGMKRHTPAGREAYECYTVSIRAFKGEEHTLQGVELGVCFGAASVEPGDRVTLDFYGKAYVGIENNRKLFRNKWVVKKSN